MIKSEKEIKPENNGGKLSRKQEYVVVALFLIIAGYLVVSGLYEPETVVYNYDVTGTVSFKADEIADAAFAAMASTDKDEELSLLSNKETVTSVSESTDSETVSTQSASSDLININTATLEQLTELYGIGEVKAQRIIEYRESHGGFSTTYDITNVDGIGDSIYNSIKDDITVDG